MSDFSEKIDKQFAQGALIGGVYKVLEFMGEGGMGLVYKVEHTLMHKEMALKVLKAEHLSEAVWKRFRNEAQAIARLDHTNVVKIYDMNQTLDGRPYYTMDLLEGCSLDGYLDQYERLPLPDALPIFRQACAGLSYAHERGVIHRDIKPGNIMLLPGNIVKIVDFGIAKLVDDGGQTIQGLTRPGEVFGSPLYMSPEQCHGSKIDARADIYSLGVTMYQALTGRPPLLGRSAIETTTMHQSTPAPKLQEKAPDLVFPEQLESVVAKMLAKAPEQRYSTLAEVAAELLAIERARANAPHAVASSDLPRPRTDLVNETYGTTTGGKTLRHRLILSGLVVTVLAVCSVILSMFPQTKKEQQKAVALPLKIPDLTTTKFSALKEINESDLPDVDHYLAKGVHYFSQTADQGKTRRFEFPKTFSVGTLVAVATKNGERTTFDAKGQVDIPAHCVLEFAATDNTKARPELLQYFRPDDLFVLRIEKLAKRHAKLGQYLSRLQSLVHLEAADSGLNDADLDQIERLKNLTTLTVGDTSIDGNRLARSSLLKNVQIISLANLKNVSPVLEQLARFHHLGGLNPNDTKLSKADIAAISSMSTLQSLWLKFTDVDDADIEKLSRLPFLQYLNLEDCKKLSPDCIASLRKFKRLSKLGLPKGVVTEEKLQTLTKDRPLLQVKLPIDID